MKINDLIAALQEQAKKHGNLDLSIEVALPEQDLPKKGANKYYNMYGSWNMTCDRQGFKTQPEFGLNPDPHGSWLTMLFRGRFTGEVSELTRQDLAREVKRGRISG